MGFSISLRSSCQLKTVLLRTNEEFVRLCDDVTEARRLYFQRSCVLHGNQDFYKLWDQRRFAETTDEEWNKIKDKIWAVDQRMKRAVMNAPCSEVVAGIMLQFEEKIFPFIRVFLDFLEEKPWYFSDLHPCCLLIEQQSLLEDLLNVFAESVSSGPELAHKVVVSALALLSFVYQYLIGCVDKGGSKTYSPGSFLFRLMFVAIVLFLGSYVWIKFRQASYTASRRKRKLRAESDVPEGVYRRAVKDTRGSVTHYKYEPRFKPRREKLESGTTLEFNYLPLGSYDTPREAEIVRHIAVVLYGKEESRPVQFEDGLCLPFPSATEPQNCPPSGKEKAVWVTRKTKELYAELLREKANRLRLAVERGTHHGHADEACRRGPPPSAPGAPSTAMELTSLPSPHGGSGIVEQPTTSESHGLGQEPPLAPGVFSPFFSDSDVDQVMSSMPRLEENDFPAIGDLDEIGGDNSETDRVFGFESPLIPPPLRASDNPTPAIFGSRPQLGVGDQGLEIIEPHLNSATAIPFKRLESLPEQVQLQQHVAYQEQRPEEFSGLVVELQQKLLVSEERNLELQQNLLESEERNSELQQNLLESEDRNSELQQNLLESEDRDSELQQKLRKAEVENEKWRSMFRQVAKLMAASNLDGYTVDI